MPCSVPASGRLPIKSLPLPWRGCCSRRLREERRQLLARTRRDFDTSSADLNVSVTAALREVEGLRQSLLDLNTTFEENVHAVDELCGEED